MRILQINNEFPPLGGGTATVNREFCAGLAGFHEVESELITSSGSGKKTVEYWPNDRGSIIKLPLNQACIHHASVIDLLKFSYSALRHMILSKNSKAFDVALAWSTLPSGLVAFLVSRLYGLPYVVRVSGPDIPGFERRYRYLYPFLKPIIKTIWRSSSLIICKCQEEAERVRQVFPRARIRVVPNGVDIAAYSPPAERPPSKPLVIVSAARLVERKGQRHAIKALAALRGVGVDARLLLVGEGDSRGEYQNLVSALGLSEHVEFAGAVAREAMPEVYRKADIFVLPSSAESMSVACLEALSCGLPLVVTSGGGSESFIEQGANGFLIPDGNAEALTEALLVLARSAELRRAYGERSREIALGFSWATTTRGIFEVLVEACSANLPATGDF